MKSRPKIAILMATYNGLEWIEEQILSIINQLDVDTTIFISDDFSTDGTFEWLYSFSLKTPGIILLPRSMRMGSAGKNFYRLICDAPIDEYDYIALSDQDDIWNLDKLSKQVDILKNQNAEGVSSDVVAFWPDGKKRLISKSQPKKDLDFIFESAGPGCSFLMTPWLISQVKNVLNNKSYIATAVEMHDWLIYSICRASARKWVISNKPSLLYRQHANNVIGANFGIKAIFLRLCKIRQGWYRNEVFKVCHVCEAISSDKSLIKLLWLLKNRTFFSQIRLMKYASQSRRKFLDRLVLNLSILLFLF